METNDEVLSAMDVDALLYTLDREGRRERRILLWLWRLFVLVGGTLLLCSLFMGAVMVQVNGVTVLRVASFWVGAAAFGFFLAALVFATVKARG